MSGAAAAPERAPYVARGATLADAPAILEVLGAAFDTWPAVELDGSALDHLEWKLTAPGHESAPATVATKNDATVAALVRWFAAGAIEGAPVAVNSTVDLAVHPEHRHRGLIRLIDAYDVATGVGGQVGVDLASNHQAILHMYAETAIVGRPVRTWARRLGFRRRAVRLARAARTPRVAGQLIAAALGRLVRAEAPADVVIETVERF